MDNAQISEAHAAIRGIERWYKQALRHRAAACWFPQQVISPIGGSSLMYMAPTHVVDADVADDSGSSPPAWWIKRLDLLALTGEFFADTQEIVYQKVKQHDLWHRPEERPSARGGYRTLCTVRDRDWLEKAFYAWDELVASVPACPISANLAPEFATPTLMVGTFDKPELDLAKMIDAAAEPEAYAIFESEVIAPESGHNRTELWLIPASWYRSVPQNAYLFEDFTSLVEFNEDGTYSPRVYVLHAPAARGEQLFRSGGAGQIATVVDCRPGQLKVKKSHVATKRRAKTGRTRPVNSGNSVDPVSPYGRLEFVIEGLADDPIELSHAAAAHAATMAEAEMEIEEALASLKAGLATS